MNARREVLREMWRQQSFISVLQASYGLRKVVQRLILDYNKVHVKISNVALKGGNLKLSKLTTMNVLKRKGKERCYRKEID